MLCWDIDMNDWLPGLGLGIEDLDFDLDLRVEDLDLDSEDLTTSLGISEEAASACR